MFSKLFSIAALVAAASAQGQGLAAVLAANQETAQLAGLVGTLPDVAGQLSSLQNITLLAPSNAALATLLNSSAGAGLASNPGLLQAVYVVPRKNPSRSRLTADFSVSHITSLVARMLLLQSPLPQLSSQVPWSTQSTPTYRVVNV